MLEGITDLIASFCGERWQATPHELDRAGKQIARMVARRPALRIFLARFLAPAVLGGAIGAYIMKRKLNLPAGTPTAGKTSSSPATASAPAAERRPEPAASVEPNGAEPTTPAEIQAAARQAEDLVFALQARTMQLG